MRRLFIAVALAAALWFFWPKKARPPEDEAPVPTAPTVQKSPPSKLIPPSPPVRIAAPSTPKAASAPRPSSAPPPPGAPAPKREEKFSLAYAVEDGVAVTQGDIVLGAPEDNSTSGFAYVPYPNAWPSSRIAFHIQPSVRNPDRVLEAFALFEKTAVQFVPYTNQTDVIVFDEGTQNCKSYVGRIGGKQPIWIAPDCGAKEIAHEILHALGFIHEQNRTDRDEFVEMLFDNIEPEHKVNFEKFPESFMAASGLAPFDYESIMMYPPWMFARGGLSTMRPRQAGEQIRPSDTLSAKDIERINKIYGNR